MYYIMYYIMDYNTTPEKTKNAINLVGKVFLSILKRYYNIYYNTDYIMYYNTLVSNRKVSYL